ncbi:MAG: protein kinase, partial [Bacteroidaceae bacterium]|nr:protein kinase [Bacteroidaceae bacterium]
LMEYLEGGPLSEYKLNGDEQSFRRIALSAAAALAYCHTSLVMHKDIKPANFFFRDKDHKQLVLGDFGISSVFQEGEEKVRTTQARTPVYAAPEMYSEVIDGVVEITPAADYYSLGITLLYVWLGRTPFTKNERVMMRMKNEGRLPGIDKAPEGVSRVIRGLTCLDSGKRWTYDEVERWYKGEDVPVEEKSFFVRYKSFVVNPEKNVVANDVKELAPLLNDYRELGIRYLYGKHIRQWLEECGNTALAMIMDDIVEQRYPTEPQSGLSAAIYAMDENFPYIGHDSEVCHSMPEVCLHVLKHADVYAERLKNPYDLLWVYVEARKKADRHQLSRYFLEYRKEVAIARFVYEIDETMPFLAHLPSDTPEQIVASFGTGECTEDQWRSLVDGRLLSWLSSHQLHTKYEPIRSLTEDKPYAKSLAYFVLYTLDSKCAFDLKSAFTPLDVAELMNRQLQKNQHTDPVLFEQELDDFIGEHGCLHFYATTRGWFTVLSNHKQILNLTSQENTERLGVYDRRIAAYRLCAALGATPSYAFETEGKTVVVKTLEELEQLDSRLVRTEMRQGALKSWLTLFFHEAPHATFEADLSYEKALRDYLMLVGKYDPSDHYYKRFMDARTGTQQVIDTTKQTLKQVIRLEMILRNSMIGTAVLLLFLLVCYGITKVDVFVNYIWFGFWIPLCLGSMLVGGIKGYFSANGVTVILLGVLGGLLTSLLPVYALKLLYRISPSLVTIG